MPRTISAVKRVADVRHHGQQQAAFGGAQVAGELVDAVAARVHRNQRLVAGGGAHVGVAVQNP